MAQTGYTPIQLYSSPTAAAVPTSGNLAAGELAINTTDEKLYFKNAAGTVKLLAANVTPVANGGTALTAGTSGGVLAYTATGTLASSGALTQYGVVLGGGAGAVPTSTAVGTATYVLTSNGSGVAPTFQAPAASGASKGQAIAFSMIFGL